LHRLSIIKIYIPSRGISSALVFFMRDIMATQTQLDFITDIETGVKALIAQGIHVKKITQVTEAAGRELIEVSQYVSSIARGKQFDLIARLAEAFLKVGLAPTCIARALESAPEKQIEIEVENSDPEPLQLEPYLPSIATQLEELERVFDVQPAMDPSEPLSKVIQLLSPLPRSAQHKVISTASVWFGVGG
jgi:hypothetical protein